MAKKRCGMCKKTKDVSEFTKDSSKKDGLYGLCKSCKKITRKKSYEKIGRETSKKLYNKKVKASKTVVYEIQNKNSNKSYIGKTNAFSLRKNAHLNKLKKGSHINKDLQKDWNDLGEESFDFNIIEEYKKDESLEIYEALEVLRRISKGQPVYNSKFTFTTEDLIKFVDFIKSDKQI